MKLFKFNNLKSLILFRFTMRLFATNIAIKNFIFSTILWTVSAYESSSLFVQQGETINLTCNSQANNPNLALAIVENGKNRNCLTECKFEESDLCLYLRLKSSNISCESRNCYKKKQCSIIFKSASIALDGIKLICLDSKKIASETLIKGIHSLKNQFKSFLKNNCFGILSL